MLAREGLGWPLPPLPTTHLSVRHADRQGLSPTHPRQAYPLPFRTPHPLSIMSVPSLISMINSSFSPSVWPLISGGQSVGAAPSDSSSASQKQAPFLSFLVGPPHSEKEECAVIICPQAMEGAVKRATRIPPSLRQNNDAPGRMVLLSCNTS